jgi:Flp pilus assembly protein TadD
LKSFRDFTPNRKWRISAAVLLLAGGFVLKAKGDLPAWIHNIEAKTGLESAFFRTMQLPYGEVLFRRPPAETRPVLGELAQQQPADADLYSLRALEDEQQLDFVAAEKDWKVYVEKAKDKVPAQWDLADFYHRRLRPKDEIAALRAIGDSPLPAAERFTPVNEQNSWKAFERVLSVIQAQALGKESTVEIYRAWIARYLNDEGLYARFLEYLVAQKEFDAATQLIASYQKAFPGNDVFPVKGKALVEYKYGSIQQGLAIYEKSFQPLWQPELVKAYFDLLGQTQGLRKFLDEARAALNKNPEDLNATARVFYYYQQQGKLDSAQQAITDLRLHKEAANSAWTPEELYICGRLLEDIHSYPEAARYYFALYNSKGANDSQERALTHLTDMLLTSPESPIRLGSGELSMYKDIATMDQGPGYFNGILSLLLSSAEPQNSYHEEEQRAVSYFHRSRAAELLALLDKNYPNAERRPELHAKLIEYYSNNGQSEAVLQGGKEFLAAFPKSPERTQVALIMADAYERLERPRDEFAIYDAVLQELAARAEKMPLGAGVSRNEAYPQKSGRFSQQASRDADGETETAIQNQQQAPEANAAFQVGGSGDTQTGGPRSPEYSRVLERYLARLVELKQIPQALGVLRREIDHNPDDPGLYERLAACLQQNNLTQEEEDVYRRAFAHFSDPSWCSKLARLYLRYRRYSELEKLTQDAVKQFDGSVLETYFASVGSDGAAMWLRLNLYANARFPHNLYFVRNLLVAYHSRLTYDHAAWLALIRQHWFEDSRLRSEYFEYLSSTNQLEGELDALRRATADTGAPNWSDAAKKNPAAVTEFAAAEVWRSHFEESAPALQSLSELYPAERELDRTASSVFRSVAYFDASKTAIAAKIEENLLAENPGDTVILARIGDIYSDRELFAQAAPYWERIPKVAPGQPGGYLDAATIYWDYFDFENALRLLDEGRKKLGNPALYGYEEGAIFETQRAYPKAIHEYAIAALASGLESPAANRLLELARRPKFRDLVNDATERLASEAHYSSPAINLRVRVLEAENRKPEMVNLLTAALDHAETIEQAAEIESIAQQQSLEAVRQHALENQAALATDPVTRMQLRYALVRFYEGKKDLPSAQRNIEALYQANPKILGVVRSTVDFYWRVKMYPQAIAVLRQAAKDSYPQLRTQFTFEAARKSTEARDFPQARALLDGLLKESPYDAQYLASMADTYAQSGDAQGLKQLYLDKIAMFRNAPLTPDERKNHVATLRRGLIPALTQLKEYAGGVDQYIELLNNFPEDEGLATEAALYAHRYQRDSQFLDFYAKTVQQSPRDYRWAMVLARMQSTLEDFPAAIESYGKAITIRPDRTDLQIARANLEERLLRFDEAAKDYEHLYQLTYKDSKWMEKIAEVRARQGRNADAVSSLKTALIDTTPERAGKYFEVARRLETWNLLEPAKSFAEQGVSVAGDELLASPENHEGAKLYARILTRLRRQDKAYARLQAAMKSASNSLPVVEQQVAKQGISAISDKQWREHVLAARQQHARTGMRAALVEMGSTVACYYTPEEKVAFAGFAEALRSAMSDADAREFAIPLAASAGLAEVEASWRYALLVGSGSHQPEFWNQYSEFIQLQRQQLRFSELGGQLEKLAPRVRPESYANVITNAAEAYRAAGDTENELRLLSSIGPNQLGGENLTRWYALLLKKDPQQLVQVAGAWTPWGESASEYVLANGSPELAHAVVAARGQTRPLVWTKSYSALVGLYFAENQPPINTAFVKALGDETIGERIGKKGNRDDQLAGDVWFYYGSRYGEYMRDMKQGTPEDFLPSELEHSPASVDGYLSLGDYYLEQSDARKAIEQYGYVLELSPGRADVHDKLALAYYKDKNRAEAIAEWKRFFTAELNQVNNSRLSETLWADFGRACDHVRARGFSADVKSEVDQLVRAYLHHNGNYRSNAVLHSAYVVQADSRAATSWLLEVSQAAPDPTIVLGDIVDVKWIPQGNRGPIYQRILEAKQASVAKSEGLEQENAKAELWNWQIRWLGYLVDLKQYTQAADLTAALRRNASASDSAMLVPYEIQCAAKLGTLDALLEMYKTALEASPSAESLRGAARQLVDSGDRQSARKVLEFVFAGQLEEHQLSATSFLGLAEIRLADGDMAGAIALLKRMVLTVGDQYQGMDSAAALLEKTNHPAEALVFLGPLSKATPWEASFRLRLAKAQLAANQDKAGAAETLAKIVTADENSYSLRVQAASALPGLAPPSDFGSQELKLIAAGANNITPADADRLFFYDARLAAAQRVSSAQEKIELLGKALADLPSRNDARIPFFRAAALLQQDELALASIEQLLQRGAVGQVSQENAMDEDVLAASEEGDADEETSTSGPLLALATSQQAQVAYEVATVMTRLGRLDQAEVYLKIAQKLEKSPAELKRISAQLADLRTRLRRQHVNATRRPVLHEALEQDRLVRPRLVAQAIAKPAAKAGGKP